MMHIHVNESSVWSGFVDLFDSLGYEIADDGMYSRTLCAYKEFRTGVSTPDTVSLIAKVYGTGEFSVELVANSFRPVYLESVPDMFVTFIEAEQEPSDSRKARQILADAEASVGDYIKALSKIKRHADSV